MKRHLAILLLAIVIIINSLELSATKKHKSKFGDWLNPFKGFKKHKKHFRYSDESESKSESASKSGSFETSYEAVKGDAVKPVKIGGVTLQSKDFPLAIKAFMSFVNKNGGCEDVTAYRKFMSQYKAQHEITPFTGAAYDPLLLEMSNIATMEQNALQQRCPSQPQPSCNN